MKLELKLPDTICMGDRVVTTVDVEANPISSHLLLEPLPNGLKPRARFVITYEDVEWVDEEGNVVTTTLKEAGLG